MLAGADGIVSVASNVVPSAFRRLADLARAGKEADAQALDARLRALYDFLGIESNPIPVKALLARRGVGRGLRLPLTELSRSDERRVGKACVSTGRSRGSRYH